MYKSIEPQMEEAIDKYLDERKRMDNLPSKKAIRIMLYSFMMLLTFIIIFFIYLIYIRDGAIV